MPDISIELGILALLLLGNGWFAMVEIAVVASRRGRLKTLAEQGNKGAALAVQLSESPGRFLSTVQVGITLFGVLSGVIGGYRLADNVAEPFKQLPWIGDHAEWIALAVVSAVITTLSVIVGELVPKRLALNSPEVIASLFARPMNRLSNFASPLVSFLNGSSDLLMRLIGVKKSTEPAISEDEVRVLIDEGLSTGVFNKSERDMVEGVFELDELTAEDLMTPRARMVWLSLDDPDEDNWRRIAGSGHSHFPVYQKTRDNVVGMVSVKALWANLSLAGNAELRSLVTPPIYIPTSLPASAVIAEFKRVGKHIALVVDEFGGLQGLVTLNDVMTAIVGRLPERGQRQQPTVVKRDDNSWLVDALLPAEEAKKALGIESDLPGEEEFSTVGGFILSRLGRIPSEGQKFVWSHYQFEVVDMDRQRVDKVLVSRLPPPPDDEDGTEKG